ncbi:hypothetical protein KBD69_00265 [Candidatus Woesebacteria bacterium]|nr:hypothetical protein [Candidatus Woesebacteria bacterium]
MTDPNTPTTPSSNPQDLIDQALGGTPTPTMTPDPTPTVTEPTLPTPEPLSAPVVVEDTPVLPPTGTVPTELTTTPVIPTMSEPPVDTKPMGEDMPLAFAGIPNDVAADINLNNVSAPIIEPVNNVVPPILTNPAPAAPVNKGKGAMSKVKMVIVAALAFFGIASATGYWAYSQYGTVSPAIIAGIKDQSEDTCSGCVNGGWMRWDKKTGTCKHTGICGSGVPGKDTEDPVIARAEDANSPTACSQAKGVWCDSTDSVGKRYSFCISNQSTTGCNQAAIDKGYTITLGKVQCECKDAKIGTNGCQNWGVSAETLAAMESAQVGSNTYNQNLMAATSQCQNGGNFSAVSSEAFICPPGVSGPCTALNGKPFKGNLGCFCGTVQVDTPNGHTSYSSTCGCNKPEETPNPTPTPTPSVPVFSTLMCSNLTRTPTTTPVIGDKVTFTCVGASVPAGSVNLSYKFRYSLNSGSYINLTNKTATTSELSIAACGNYSVECQACGTINGVLTCDPNWAGATTQ